MTYRKVYVAAALGTVGLLAGCGGSDAGFGTSTRTYNETLALANPAINAADNAQATAVQNQGAPTATYEGFILFDYATSASNIEEAAGEITLNVNFTAGSVAGNISNSVSENQGPFTGNLNITGGNITGGTSAGSDNLQFDADVSGTITNDVGALEITDGDIDGDFGGTNAEFLYGFADGDVEFDGTPVAGGFTGEYGAERQ